MILFIPDYFNGYNFSHINTWIKEYDSSHEFNELPFYFPRDNDLVVNTIANSIRTMIECVEQRARDNSFFPKDSMSGAYLYGGRNNIVETGWHQDGNADIIGLVPIIDTDMFDGGEIIISNLTNSKILFGPYKMKQGDLLLFHDTIYQHNRLACTGPKDLRRTMLNIKIFSDFS